MPFGESFVDEHSSSWESPYKFSGKERDEETGLSYFGTRYYDPKTSVWYGIDSLAGKYPSVGGMVYCLQNPIRLIDPNGINIQMLTDKHKQRDISRKKKHSQMATATYGIISVKIICQ